MNGHIAWFLQVQQIQKLMYILDLNMNFFMEEMAPSNSMSLNVSLFLKNNRHF